MYDDIYRGQFFVLDINRKLVSEIRIVTANVINKISKIVTLKPTRMRKISFNFLIRKYELSFLGMF